MTLVSITLTEGEQEVILRNAQSEQTFPPEMHEFASLAEKVRRARDAAPWTEPGSDRPGDPVKFPGTGSPEGQQTPGSA